VHLVDPGPLIEERIHDEVDPLEAALAATSDERERKSLKRQIRRKRREIRRLRWFPVSW